MIVLGILAGLSLVLAALPALVFINNLRYFQRPKISGPRTRPAVSVVIPARNEASNILGVLNSVCASEAVELEVVVVDDRSEDDTARLVETFAATDHRVRLISAPALPPNWCGKQHACHVGSENSAHELILFLDADVRLSQVALAAMIDSLEGSGTDLLSGFPRQVTASWLESLVIPLIHFVLLGFLPLRRMRLSTNPLYAAGCGQLFLVRRAAYRNAGGHTALKASRMDGIALPRAMRNANYRTDIIDATDFADCRMYHSAGEVWSGLAKNSTEGLGAPARIVPATVILLGGQTLPFALLMGLPWMPLVTGVIVVCAVVLAYTPRVTAAIRFRQSSFGALLHPVGIVLLLTIQWYGLFRQMLGKSATWRGRAYPARANSASC